MFLVQYSEWPETITRTVLLEDLRVGVDVGVADVGDVVALALEEPQQVDVPEAPLAAVEGAVEGDLGGVSPGGRWTLRVVDVALVPPHSL